MRERAGNFEVLSVVKGCWTLIAAAVDDDLQNLGTLMRPLLPEKPVQPDVGVGTFSWCLSVAFPSALGATW